MSKPSGAGRAATYAVLVLVVVAAGSFLINSQIGGIQVYDVYPTNSMVPTLEVGDLVVVHSVPYSSIHLGDVIVFSPPISGGGCEAEDIVHRVVNITQAGIITQGDNRFTNPVPDEPPLGFSWGPVTPQCVKGVVVIALPYLGKISEAFPPPLNYFLVGIIIIVIFLVELFGSGKKDGEDKAEEAPIANAWRIPWKFTPGKYSAAMTTKSSK